MPNNYGQGRGGRGGASSKKRKAGPSNGAENSSSSKKSRGDGPPAPRQNTAIYVTGIPTDATIDEVHELFSRKCGVVAEEIDSGKPRIKLYTDGEGKPKGDALIVFFKPQSVEMAIMLLDDTTFRFGDPQDGPHMMIQAADSSYKKTQYVEEDSTAASSGTTPVNGSSSNGNEPTQSQNPQQQQRQQQPQDQQREESAGQQEKKVRTEKERQKIRHRAEKLSAKLADWSDDEPYVTERQPTKWDKTVILKHMFTLSELDEDPTAILDIKEDIREECDKLGEVKNVVLFDLEEEGIVSVKFKDIESADACVQVMDGRNFGGQAVEASIATGKEKFRQAKKKVEHSESDDSDA